MLNKIDFKDRLEQVMAYYDHAPSSLADLLQIQRSSISHLLSGRNNPSLEFVLKMLDAFPDLSFEWLVRGEGNIEKEAVHEIKNKVPQNMNRTPTLFDDLEVSIKPTQKKELPKETKETLISTPIQKETSNSKEIDKILVLYKDGSFDKYQ